MLVQATRAVSSFSLRAAFYVGLFIFVAVFHIAFTNGLRAMGVGAAWALFASGAIVLSIVLAGNALAARLRAQRAEARARAAQAQGLPDGPCCLVWAPHPAWETPLPWRLEKPIRAQYPALARRLGVEGYAVIDFEIGSDGKARHLHCLDAWPNDHFYVAAADALRRAQFTPKRGVRPRMGEPYRLPFLFRIAGASDITHEGAKARPHRPVLGAAATAIERFRRAA